MVKEFHTYMKDNIRFIIESSTQKRIRRRAAAVVLVPAIPVEQEEKKVNSF